MKKQININKLKNLIEPFFHKYLDKEIYEIEYIKPLNLIKNMRFDLYSKLNFLDGLNENLNDYEDLYYSFINAFSLGQFLEPGNNQKKGFESFTESFKNTYFSIQNDGFLLNKSIIPISKNGIILNGSHRLACAIKLNIEFVPCIRLNISSPKYNYQFFKYRKVSQDFLDQSANKLINIDRDISVAIIWPAGNKRKLNFDKYIPNIFYKKDIYFSFIGLKNVISNIYLNEKWLGSIENGFPGAFNKALPCHSEYDPLTVILFKPNKKEDKILIKKNIRSLVGIGKSSIHINDTYEEVLEISKLLLNSNTIHFLNNFKFNDLPKDFLTQVKDFKEFAKNHSISLDKVALDGSMVLSSYCLRNARDIDFIIDSIERKKIKDIELNNLSNISIHNDVIQDYYKLKIDKIIHDSRNYFTFLDLKMVSIKLLLEMKYLRNEFKDRIDIKLIKSIYSSSWISSIFLKFNQQLIFNFIKIRNNFIAFLIKIKIYNFIKKLLPINLIKSILKLLTN